MQKLYVRSFSMPLIAGLAFAQSSRPHAGGIVLNWGGQQGGRTEPAAIPQLEDAVAVAVGERQGLALSEDGTVWIWDQLSDTASANGNLPLKVPALTDVVAIAAGLTENLAVKSDGSVWTFGSVTAAPRAVHGLSNIVAAAAGASVAAGATVSPTVVFNWPATATRVKLTINFSANSGAYAGSSTATIFR